MNWVIYNRTHANKGVWKFGIINGFNISNKVWNDCAVQVGWVDKKGNNWWFRGNGGKKFT